MLTFTDFAEFLRYAIFPRYSVESGFAESAACMRLIGSGKRAPNWKDISVLVAENVLAYLQ